MPIVSAAKQHMSPPAENAELGVKLVSLSKGDVPDRVRTEGDINLSVGRRIRRRRRLLGMTQRDLAVVLGLQFQQVHKYECSASRISASRLHILAGALKVPISYFFSEMPNDAVVGSNKNDSAVIATAELLSEKESRDLLDAYAKLPERVRRSIGKLAKDLGEDLGKTHEG